MDFCDDEDLLEMYGPLNLAEKLVVFVPLNDASSTSGGGSHWAMLAVVKVEETGDLGVFLLDSGSGSSMRAVANAYLARLKLLMRISGIVQVTEVRGYPKQGNMFDCGIFSLCGAEAVLEAYKTRGEEVCSNIKASSCFSSVEQNVL
eukprot:CAMPEP_0185583724 /NCGR_PEP_ID=MMETSP0434-20130131/27162_1 /TAXON_ID=626734 ORGANISM="Favella taraikaensis, Strain Fe Narragansett Bay" /NCGR_SAMPLE_ID=MMETSP0434 /ASSEMBLY_ACC=CAM_ASM_000379 /LENGTH=146 /DNA_ID=CAMNT_0028203003 /DNA_START=92 /DNA_END=529 /DNA_ORIENTATION=+